MAVAHRREWRLPALSSVLALAGLALTALAARGTPSLTPPTLLYAACLAGLFFLLERRQIQLTLGRRGFAFSLTDIPLVLALALLSPPAVLLVVVGGSVAAFASRGQRGIKLLYNCAQVAFSAGAAALTYTAVLASASPEDPRGWAAAGLAALLSGWISLTAVGLAVRLSTGQAVWGTLLKEYVTAAAVAPALASFALVGVVLLAAQPEAALLLVAPLAFIAWSYAGQRRLRETSEGTEALYRFTRSLGTTTGVEESAEVVLREARDLLHAATAQLVLLEGEGGRRFRLGADDEVDPDRVPAWADLAWCAGATAATLHVTPGDGGPVADRLVESADGQTLLLAGPLLHEGQVLGALLVAGRTGPQSRFRRDERALFEALCGHAAVALLAAELVDQLREEVSRRESEALHDGLTGLRNRRAFAADCARAIGRSAETGRGLALAVVDLDLFKEVNDTLGHAFGDLLLAEVATRLGEAARPGEVVARLGGDEFALLVPDVVDEEGALRAVRRLVDSLGRPLSLDGVRLAVSATAGVTLAPRDGDTPDSLLRRADVALYTGKRRGSGLEVYSRTDDVSSRRRLDLLAELTHAMDEGQVWVAYQPKARTSDGVVTGVEALARWDSPRFGSVGPAEFVPLVETNGQLRRLTSHVLDTALAQVARWRSQGLRVGVAVNISTRALVDVHLADEVAVALDRAGVPAELLTLEITEGSVMGEVSRSLASLQRLDALGVRLAVDDFGTGWSSLSYLTRLPVDEVKIDRSFVQGMSTDPADAAVVSSTVGLAHELGLRVVAEGVEDPDVWGRLAELGCDEVQGYLLHRPAAAEEVTRWLEQPHLPPAVAGGRSERLSLVAPPGRTGGPVLRPVVGDG